MGISIPDPEAGVVTSQTLNASKGKPCRACRANCVCGVIGITCAVGIVAFLIYWLTVMDDSSTTSNQCWLDRTCDPGWTCGKDVLGKKLCLPSPCVCSAQGRKDDFIVMAHMVNTLEAVSWAAAQGVNAMEVDVVFDHTQQHEVRKVFHGGTCDCNAIPLLGFHESLDPDNNICGFGDDSVCRVLEKESATPHSLGDITCDASSKVPALFQAVAGLDSTSAISLFYIDSKLETMEPSELRAAALSISANLKEHLFGRGYTGNVIIGCPMVYHLEFIKVAVGEFEGTAYEGRVAVTIDGFIDYVTSANLVNLPDGPKQYTTPMVLKKLLAFPHRALSFGKTACAPAQRRHFEASQLAAMNYRAGVLSVPGVVWTIDDKETMRNFVKYHGARGIMTNVPSNALQVANESGFRLLKLVNQNFTKATSNAVVDKLSASCDC